MIDCMKATVKRYCPNDTLTRCEASNLLLVTLSFTCFICHFGSFP
uniref:Uncharacterized protein n=1 Tax=Arundo donax TaxID=35708 RepID=A0A0A9AGK6_ARUDO